MEVLVLGGSRFVGLRLTELLHRQGHNVSVLNRGKEDATLPYGVQQLVADRNDPLQIKAVLSGKQYDSVFDISGYTTETLKPVVDVLQGNVGHYIFCSTTAVYHLGEVNPIAEDFPLNCEAAPDSYAGAKILCEQLLRDANVNHDFPATVIRPPVIYGPHNYLPEREFSYFARITQGRKLIIPGDGRNIFHPIHVDDLATAFASVPGKEIAIGKSYNIMSRHGTTFNLWFTTIADVMGKSIEILHSNGTWFDETVTKLEIQPPSGFVYYWGSSYLFDTEKARQELGWFPKYNIKDGLEMTYKWWVSQGLDKKSWDFSPEDRLIDALDKL